MRIASIFLLLLVVAPASGQPYTVSYDSETDVRAVYSQLIGLHGSRASQEGISVSIMVTLAYKGRSPRSRSSFLMIMAVVAQGNMDDDVEQYLDSVRLMVGERRFWPEIQDYTGPRTGGGRKEYQATYIVASEAFPMLVDALSAELETEYWNFPMKGKNVFAAMEDYMFNR